LLLFELLDLFAPSQHCTKVVKWQKLLGELRSMVLAIPGGKILFIILQEVLRHKCDHGARVRLTQPVHCVLQDFRWLTENLTRWPKRIAEIIPKAKPDTMGAQDASALGMGRVHSMPQEDGQVLPLLWRSHFSRAIQERLVSFDNPAGDINNSELDLAVSVAQHDTLAKKIDVRESTIHNSSDNVAMVWWQRKGSTSSSGPTDRPLHLQALHQCHYHYVPLFDYIAGEAMADVCSRLWHLSDAHLLAYFELTFPQNRPW
jgi:hypothetical protein